MHDHEISSSDGPKRQSCRRRFRSWSDRSSIICGRLGAAIPLPKRVSPPVTEVGSSGLTKLLISRENELGLRGSPRGGPSEGRAGNQRDQRESSDQRLHDTSPCLHHRPRFVHERRGRSAGVCSRPLPSDTRSGRNNVYSRPLDPLTRISCQISGNKTPFAQSTFRESARRGLRYHLHRGVTRFANWKRWSQP